MVVYKLHAPFSRRGIHNCLLLSSTYYKTESVILEVLCICFWRRLSYKQIQIFNHAGLTSHDFEREVINVCFFDNGLP